MEPRKKVTLSYILEKKANGEKLARTLDSGAPDNVTVVLFQL